MESEVPFAVFVKYSEYLVNLNFRQVYSNLLQTRPELVLFYLSGRILFIKELELFGILNGVRIIFEASNVKLDF